MENNKGKIIFSIFILILIIVGGLIGTFYFVKKFNNKPVNNTVTTENKIVDIRIDNNKDYIYYTNENLISSEYGIEYKEIIFNFDGYSDLQTTINSDNEELYKTIKYNSDNSLKEASYKTFNIYVYRDYLSLVIDYYNFDGDIKYIKSNKYVFNKKDGTLYNNSSLLNAFNKTEEDVKNIVTNYLNDKNLLDSELIINTEETVNNLGEYVLYVDKMGNLVISVVVKSNQNDYNEVIIIN